MKPADKQLIKDLAATFYKKKNAFEALGKKAMPEDEAKAVQQCVDYEVMRAEMLEDQTRLASAINRIAAAAGDTQVTVTEAPPVPDVVTPPFNSNKKPTKFAKKK